MLVMSAVWNEAGWDQPQQAISQTINIHFRILKIESTGVLMK